MRVRSEGRGLHGRLATWTLLVAMVVGSMSGAQVASAVDGPDGQVVGGVEVPNRTYRFLVAVLRKDFGSHWCGGTLLSNRYVLTAAHCVSAEGAPTPPETFVVVKGRTDITDRSGREFAVARIAIHPDYEWRTFANDVAILELAGRKPAHARTVALPAAGDRQFERPGDLLTVAGWGSIVQNIYDDPAPQPPPVYPDRMRETGVRVDADDAPNCGPAYPDLYDPALMLCASETDRDSCQGDSGGPLFADAGSGIVQVGIVSNGNGCADPSYAGIYTRVSAPEIRNFIRDVTGL